MHRRPMSATAMALIGLSTALAAADAAVPGGHVMPLPTLPTGKGPRQPPLRDKEDLSARQRKRQAKLERRAARAAQQTAHRGPERG